MEKILLLFLLFCGSCYGQSITNGSFETLTPLQYGTYGIGTVPGWTLTGTGGLWQPGDWQPGKPYFSSLPDGKQVLWLNAASVTQDLGAPGASDTTYSLTVWVGNRAPIGLVPTNTYTIAMAVNGGVFCSMTGDSAQVPAGTFQKVVLPCPMGGVPTAGNLQVIISSAGSQVTFDSVSLSTSGPLTISLPGMNTSFYMAMPPPCLPADGTCVYSIRVTLPAGAVLVTQPDGTLMVTGRDGKLELVKDTSNNGQQIVVVAVAKSQ